MYKMALMLNKDIFKSRNLKFLITVAVFLSLLFSIPFFTVYANDVTSALSSPLSSLFGQGELIVGNAGSGSVSFIDLENNHIIKNVSVSKGPHDIKISDDQQTVFTTDTDSSTISIINTTDKSIIKQIPIQGVRALHGIAIYENYTRYNNNISDTNNTKGNNTDSILYVGDIYGNKVLAINWTGNNGSDSDNIIEKIYVGKGPEYLEISPSNEVMYVANLWSPISVIDLKDKDKRVIKSIDSGKTPHGLSFNTNGSNLYIVNMYSNSLSIIDTNKHEVIKNITVGEKPEYVKLSPDERYAYVTNLNSNTVSKVDLAKFEVIKEIPVGNGPHGIAFSADGNLMYISNMKSNDISVISTADDRVLSTIPSGGIEPHQIVLKKPSIRILFENVSTASSSPPLHPISTPNIYIKIADDPTEQSKGLMYRNNLESNSGMLFVFDKDEIRSFWMKNTLIPLDMLFIDRDFKIVDIIENAQPCKTNTCPSYISKQPAKYVLEVNAGFVKENKIDVGDIIV